jgi:hypothetical protein
LHIDCDDVTPLPKANDDLPWHLLFALQPRVGELGPHGDNDRLATGGLSPHEEADSR